METAGAGELRSLLMERWDPIHVHDEPMAQGEYDGYLGPLANLLRKGATRDDVARFLSESEHRMGFTTCPDELGDVASEVLRWYTAADT